MYINSLTAMGSGGNKKIPPRGISTVGIVRKVLLTPTELSHKHHNNGGAICPSYGMGSIDPPDLTPLVGLVV
jgi:hypothetical protein